jgi:hypothetical protein
MKEVDLDFGRELLWFHSLIFRRIKALPNFFRVLTNSLPKLRLTSSFSISNKSHTHNTWNILDLEHFQTQVTSTTIKFITCATFS